LPAGLFIAAVEKRRPSSDRQTRVHEKLENDLAQEMLLWRGASTAVGGPMDIASVFAWFAQESLSIAEQANEPKQRQTFTQLALLWATAAQQCGGGAKLASAWREDAEALKRGEKAAE
jgi:hypothetical protein